MNREVEDIYGCFRCGTVRPMCDRNPDTDKIHCGVCGETSVVTFRQSLDMLNSLWLSYKREVDEAMQYDEYYFDYEETD